jgi:splicing factor 3B subunit 1
MQAEGPGGQMTAAHYGLQQPEDESLPPVKPEDYEFFAAIMTERALGGGVGGPEADSAEDARDRKILKLLLRIKSGTPAQRKVALRQITQGARDFGAGPLFGKILPLLMSPSLEDQERHLLVKVIDRVLFRLDDLVRPYVHKILVVTEPLLVDADYYVRAEGREIISNLAKAAGRSAMITAMRPDVDHEDEDVRNATSRALAVVASSLGIPELLPFLRALCRSKRSWAARHTGSKIVQQTAILMGAAVLPHLSALVACIEPCLTDADVKVRTITAHALAALATSAHPYGIDAFDPILIPLWKATRTHTGKQLSAHLLAIGCLIPLMEPAHAAYYAAEVLPVLTGTYASPDPDTVKTALTVTRQLATPSALPATTLLTEVLPQLAAATLHPRVALSPVLARGLVLTLTALAGRVGAPPVVSQVVALLKSDNEAMRRLASWVVGAVVQDRGADGITGHVEEGVVDGLLTAFQDASVPPASVLSGARGGSSGAGSSGGPNGVVTEAFSVVMDALGVRARPYLPQVCAALKFRLQNKDAWVRRQAAEMVGRLAAVIGRCGEAELLNHLGVVFYELLGEEYPAVLAAIIGGLRAIVGVVGVAAMKPPVQDLLPRLTPILRNRQEDVLEQAIGLVGAISDGAGDLVPAKEWLRICHELLDMLKAGKLAIRRAAISTFGHIARAVGPLAVLETLLDNLQVQNRQSRVCTVVAIAVVAERCGAWAVIPFLLNEYRVPEANVQHGVLKVLSFLFEYVREEGRHYSFSVTPMLEDALVDIDVVHRQTAAASVKHLCLAQRGDAAECAVSLMCKLWPNIFEQSPHVKRAVREGIAAIAHAAGPGLVMAHLVQGLFHPAQIVRRTYWAIHNELVVAHAEPLVNFYPDIPGVERTVLDSFI